MRRKAAALFAALSTVLVVGVSAGADLPASAAAPSPVGATAGFSDPLIGPHARAEAEHRNDPIVHTARASGPIVPRQTAKASVNVAGASTAPTTSGTTSLTREVFGFAPHWAIQAGQQTNWNYTLLSTLAYFGLAFQADGAFSTSDNGWMQFGSANFLDMENRAHAAGDRVLAVTTAFDNATICSLVDPKGAMPTAINNTVAAIRQQQLDGVNVDFEGKNVTCPNGQSLQSGLTNYMAQLKAALPTSYVTIDTYSGAASWDAGEFRIDALAPIVDAMFIMAYDMNFDNMPQGGAQAGPNAPLNGWTYNDTLSVSQYLSKAPASKILLGVPYYGRKWCTVDTSPYSMATRDPTSHQVVCPNGSGTPTAVSYSQTLSDFACAQQLQKNWDNTASSPWATWFSPSSGDPCGGNFASDREMYYDDATSLGLKYDLVNANNLRGTGMWALGDDGTSNDLWNELAVKFAYWKPWVALGGSLASGPAVDSQGSGKLDVFAAGQNHALYQKSFDGTNWSAWQPLGGQLSSDPAAVSWGTGRIDVFARGMDYVLYHKTFSAGAWSDWQSLGGQLSSAPAVSSWGPNRLDVFAAGLDHVLYQKVFDGTTWSDWQSLGGQLSSAPGAVSWGTNRVDIVARGMDGSLYHKSFDGTTWTGWDSLGGYLSTAASISSRGSGLLDVFAAGRNGILYYRTFDASGWSPWQWLGGQLSSSPASVSSASNRIDVFARGMDLVLYQKSYISP